MFKIVVIVALAAVLFTGLTYFNMTKHADRFMVRIEREVVALFDRRDGLGSIEESVMRIAKEEGIALAKEDLTVRIAPINSLGAAMSAPESSTEAIEVVTRFRLERYVFSGNYTRRVIKYLTGAPSGSQSYSSGGFSSGVNMSSPSRDIQSHRDSIGRAVRGENE